MSNAYLKIYFKLQVGMSRGNCLNPISSTVYYCVQFALIIVAIVYKNLCHHLGCYAVTETTS